MLTEALELDEATAGRLFPILARYDDQLEQHLVEGALLRQRLEAALAGGGAPAAQLDAVIDALVVHQRALRELEEQRFRDVRKVLTSRQAARLLVVLPDIDQRIQRQIQKLVRKRGGDAAADDAPDDAPDDDRRRDKPRKRRGARRAADDHGLRNPFEAR
jgi:hypothetical protein